MSELTKTTREIGQASSDYFHAVDHAMKQIEGLDLPTRLDRAAKLAMLASRVLVRELEDYRRERLGAQTTYALVRR